MKKSLLALLTVAFLGGGTIDGAPSQLPQRMKSQSGRQGAVPKKCMTNHRSGISKREMTRISTRSGSELQMDWGYCSDPYNAYLMPEGEIRGAIMVTKKIASEWAGAEISAVQVANPTNLDVMNPMAGHAFSVWISESLDGEPICSGEGVFGKYGLDYSSADLDKPYVLKDNTAIYIGYTYDVPPQDENDPVFSFVTDFAYPPANTYSAYLYSTVTGFDENYDMIFGDEYGWKNVTEECGNICITATLSGDMLPTDNINLLDFAIPRVVEPYVEFDFEFYTHNLGANLVSDIDLTLDVEGMEPQVRHIDLLYGPLGYNQMSMDDVAFSCDRIGNNIPYTLRVSAINGVPVEDSFSISGTFVAIEEGFQRNVVFEELTGTWCGWCVVGYAGMEYMKKNYSDYGFIGIALHGDDPMDVLAKGHAYAPLADNATEGFPDCYMDRDWGYSIYPEPGELEMEFLKMIDMPAFASINAEMTVDSDNPRNVTLSTKTMFAVGEQDADYGIAYTVVEDNVGPYDQTNYAAGSGSDYFGFGNLGSPVSLIFNDVARNCSHPMPFADSLPTATEAYTEYEFKTEIELTDVSDLEKYRIVAMVIDKKSGTIQNACQVSPQHPSSVENIGNSDGKLSVTVNNGLVTVNSKLPADIFSPDGRKVAASVNGSVPLPAGMYIVTTGNRSVKVVVR